MSYRDLPIVGEELKESEWPECEAMIKEVEGCGFHVVKILNFIGGSTKFIAQMNEGEKMPVARRSLEEIGWRMVTPYYSQGKVIGFKVAKVHKASDMNAWG